MLKNNPVFIVGAPRSGTTLTAKILGRHSSLFMPGETHFFSDIYSNKDNLGSADLKSSKDKIWDRLKDMYKRYNEPEDQLRINQLFNSHEKVLSLQNNWSSYKDVFSSFMEAQAQSVGKIRWGNNAPKDLFFVDEILQFFPGAKLVVCVRDPRDYLVSYKKRALVTADDQKERISSLYHPLITSLLWKMNIRKLDTLKSKLDETQLFIQSYEEIVTQPDAEIQKLCNFLNIKYETQMQKIVTNNSSEGSVKQGIFSSSIGRWERELSNEEVYLVEHLAGKQLLNYGYIKSNKPINYSELFKLISSTPHALYRALSSNKQVSGPVMPYLVRRLKTLLH